MSNVDKRKKRLRSAQDIYSIFIGTNALYSSTYSLTQFCYFSSFLPDQHFSCYCLYVFISLGIGDFNTW